MQILSTKPKAIVRNQPSQPAPRPALASSEDRFDSSELVRDFGINPKAMFKRAFLERPPEEGSSIENGKPATPFIADNLKSRFQSLISTQPTQQKLQSGINSIAESYGVYLNFEKGLPMVNWDQNKPAHLDIRHSGGPSANHEMVHAVQCVIGASCALGTKANEKFRSAQGRDASSLQELQPYLQSLSDEEKSQAMTAMVTPMEEQAYSKFEKAAFHATGMMGKASKNKPHFHERLSEVVDSYSKAYKFAKVPELATTIGPDIYGGIGHIARTNGETALVVGGVGLAYYSLAKQALKLHPFMAIPVVSPLAYLLYRSTVSG